MINSRAASRLNAAVYLCLFTSGFSFYEIPVSVFLKPDHFVKIIRIAN